MEQAFAWVNNIAQWLGSFIPKWELIEPTHMGVLYVSYWTHTGPAKYWWRGWATKVDVLVLAPGTHFYWPVRSKLLNHPVVRQARDLRELTFTTNDPAAQRKTMGAAGVITFEIVDILKAMVTSWNTDETVVDIALSAVKAVCSRYGYDDLKAAEVSGELDKQLKAEAQKALTAIGIKVIKLNLTDLAPTRNIKLSNSNFQVA